MTPEAKAEVTVHRESGGLNPHTTFPLVIAIEQSLQAVLARPMRDIRRHRGIWIESTTIQMLAKAKAASSWPKTVGTVYYSKILIKPFDHYEVDIRFSYEVQGKSYQSMKIRAREVSSTSRSEVDEFLDKYPKNSRVEVFYNPADHAEAYLIVGADLMGYFLVVSPLFLISIFAMYLFCRMTGRIDPGNPFTQG